ncbi:MAG: YHYH protein [Actinomycetota bacterium]
MHHPSRTRTRILLAVLASVALIVAACGDADDDVDGVATTESPSDTSATTEVESTESPSDTEATDDASGGGEVATEIPDDLASDWLGSYELANVDFGTMVTVTVDDGTRTIVTNALPDHETGEFPNAGNPNAITEQDLDWEFPATGTMVGTATPVRTTGVAVNGIKFEPATAESVTCAGGENYRIEALQEVYDLGLDFNNAHVQPTGEYHYHGVSELLVDAYSQNGDLVHVGFAADGNLIYYSKSGAYASGYALVEGTRTGSDCTASGPDDTSFDLDGTAIDGTYTSDYAFDAANGDLDECNGVEIDGTYVYLVTDTYPFVGRCVMGDPAADAGGGGGGAGGGGAPPAGGGGGAEGGAPPDAPDFGEAAATLGITEDELVAALGSPPDLDAAAETLGLDVADLEAVLPAPPG